MYLIDIINYIIKLIKVNRFLLKLRLLLFDL